MKFEREIDLEILSSPHRVELEADGRHIVYASSGLWACDLRGRVTTTFRKPSGYGVSEMFVMGAGRIVAQSAGHLRVWNLRTGTQEVDFSPDTLGYHVLRSVSSDGALALTTTQNKSFSVWDLKREKAVVSFKEKRSFATSAALSSDGGMVVHGGTDGVVRFFDVKTAQHFARSPGKGWIEVITRSDDGRFFASGGRAGVVQLWTPAGKLHRTLAYRAKIVGIALSPDGRLVIAHGTHAAPVMWSTETGTELATLDEYPTTGVLGGTRCVRFSQDGKRVITAGNDCRVCVSRLTRTKV